jgi:O-antigen ligase
MTILLVNYRYRFLTFFVGFLAILVAVKKYRAMLLKIFIPMFLFISAFYLFISAFFGRTSLLDRFLLSNYENDVDSLRRRVVMLGQAWEVFTQFPIFGVGTGNYKDNVQVTYERFGGRVYEPFYKILQNVYAYPHNWFVLVLAENGLVGFLILMWVLYSFFSIDAWLYKNLKNEKHLIFITLSIISWLYVFANLFTMMHNSLPMVIIFWAFRGMIERIYYEKKYING